MKALLELIGLDDSLDYKNRILYLMVLASILVAGFFLFFYITVMPFLPAIVVHILYILFNFFCYYLLKHKYFRLTKFSMILAHLLQLTLAVYIWFPVDTHYNIYYFMVPMTAFLVLRYDQTIERRFATISSLVSMLLFIFSELLFTDFYMYETSHEINQFLTAFSTISIFIPMTYIFRLFAKDLYLSHKALEMQANTDALTDLANRRVLFEQGNEEHLFSSKFNEEFALIIMDIDHFKNINDQYGHPAGDTLLRSLTQLIQKNTREGDIFARYGGEEFALLLPRTSSKNADLIANKLLNLVREASFTIEGEAVHITISLGVARYKQNYKDFDHMMRVADKALYIAKNSGRDQIILR